MVKYLQVGLILFCMVSLVSGCASVTDRPLPFQNYCGFCDSKIPEPIPEPVVEPVPEPVPEPAVVEEVKEEVAPVKVCEKIVLRGVNFDFDKSNIKPEFIPVLDEAVEILKTNRDCGINVIIEGHTDWTGTEKYNQGLSERRAASVCKYLVEKGISQNSLETVGYGETNPIADNHTRDGRSMNRRVEFKILD
jgi:outer membrane protein OmpA-like peptidoglycan-associated protein